MRQISESRFNFGYIVIRLGHEVIYFVLIFSERLHYLVKWDVSGVYDAGVPLDVLRCRKVSPAASSNVADIFLLEIAAPTNSKPTLLNILSVCHPSGLK